MWEIEKLPIDLTVFEDAMKLSYDDLTELIATVGSVVLAKDGTLPNNQDKLSLGLIKIAFGTTILQQCGCSVELIISNGQWPKSIIHKTGLN